MRWDIVGIAGLVVGLVGVGASIWIHGQSTKQAEIAQCEGKDLVLKRAQLSLEQAEADLNVAMTELQNANPDLVNAYHLGIMKRYHRNLLAELKYGELSDAVWDARSAVEEHYSLNLSDEPYDEIPRRLFSEANELFLSQIGNAGYPRSQNARALLARELQAYLADDLDKYLDGEGSLNSITLPSVDPEVMDIVWGLLKFAAKKAEYLRDDATRYDVGLSLQGAADLERKISDYEIKLRALEQTQPRLEAALTRAKTEVVTRKAAFENASSEFRSSACTELLSD